MPYIHLRTNTHIAPAKAEAIKTALGQAISLIPGKSEQWLMVDIEPEQLLYFQGTDAPAAMVQVSVFGSANPAAYEKLTARICGILNMELDIDDARVYVKYDETTNWGWNGGNF